MSYIEFDSLNSNAPVVLKLKSEVESFLAECPRNVETLMPVAIVGIPGSGRKTLAQFIQKQIFKKGSSEMPIYAFEQAHLLGQWQNGTIYIFDQEDDLEKIQFSQIFRLPTLAERKEDLIKLAEFHLEVFSLMLNKGKMIMSDKAKEKILAYSWNGQFAEFEAVIENAVQLTPKNMIEPEHLVLKENQADLNFSLGQKLENVERQYILQTLFFVQQNRTKAAEVLGISIRTLRNKLNQYRQEGFI